MKAIATLITAIVTTLTISASANAMVQLPGTFVPAQCGAQQYQGNLDLQGNRNIIQVCLGKIAGEALGTKAVEFRLNDGTTRTFKVSSTANLLVSFLSGAGDFRSMFYLVSEEGERTTMKVVQTNGQVDAAAGSLEGIRYYVPKFEVVFTVQDQSL